nr:PF20097 family protein [Oscillibacter valericigenes]
MACPWCGREMEMGYLSGSRGVFWIRGVPTARKFWLGAGRGNIIRVDTEGGLMTPHRTAWLCRACRRMVLEAPGNMWKIPPAENSGERTAPADCRTDETEDT